MPEKLSAKSLAEYLGNLPGADEAKAQKKPVLFYYYSKARRGSGRAAKPTPQAEACGVLEKNLFGGRNKRIGVAAKFFACLKLNVTSVTPQKNPVFNALRAPIVVLMASDGSVVSTLSRKITAGSLLSAMIITMRKSGIDTRKISTGESVLKKISSLEDRKALLRTRQKSAEGALKQAKASRRRSRVASAERHLKTVHAQLKEVEEVLSAAYDAWKKLASG